MVDKHNVAQGQSGNHTVLDIDVEALLAAQRQNADGFTTAELAVTLGISVDKMRKILSVGVPAGTFRRTGRKSFENWDGRTTTQPVYVYVG